MTIEAPSASPVMMLALVDLAECLCAELAATGAGPTCWCGLVPGAEVAWDYCTECTGDVCGMGWVRVIGLFPYDTFPVGVVDDRCIRPLAVAVEVGATRCLHVPDGGEPPTEAAMLEATLAQSADALAMWRALKCCDTPLAVQQYTPIGPTGGCVGGTWLAYIPLD